MAEEGAAVAAVAAVAGVGAAVASASRFIEARWMIVGAAGQMVGTVPLRRRC